MSASHTDKSKNYLNAESGFWSWMTTLDHKRIGVMYLFSTLLFFSVGGFFALWLRAEHWSGGATLTGLTGPLSFFNLDAAKYNRVYTLHGAIMVFMYIIPNIPGALGNFLLPIMLGAKDVAFPRLNLMSFYLLMIGAVLAVTAIITGGVDTGWTFYTPYSIRSAGSVIIMATGVFIMGFSSILTGLNFVATTHEMKTRGMSWNQLPLFVWATYATAIIQILATPVIGLTVFLLILERALGIGIFDPSLGGDAVLFQHFFWFYSHPAVYIMIVPAMGVISEIIPAFSKKKIFGYKAIAYSSLAIAFASFIVWGHHMFVSGQSYLASFIFSLMTIIIGIPTAIKIVNWTATMYRGKITLSAPMLYAMAFIFMFSIGGLTGLFLISLSVDVHLHDTYFVVAHFHYVMMGGATMAMLGGLYYWWPKIFGKMYNETLAKFSACLMFLGFNTTFLIQFTLGYLGMPRRYYNYPARFEIYHRISTVGSWMVALSFLTTLFVLIRSLRAGEKAPDNPWGAKSLEWETSSPPPVENFHHDPVIGEPYNYGDDEEKGHNKIGRPVHV